MMFVGTRLRTVHRPSSTAADERRRSVTQIVRRAVENFRFFELGICVTDPEGAVAESQGEGLIKSTGRMYRQDYVLFLRAVREKIAFHTRIFDPVAGARALDTPT